MTTVRTTWPKTIAKSPRKQLKSQQITTNVLIDYKNKSHLLTFMVVIRWSSFYNLPFPSQRHSNSISWDPHWGKDKSWKKDPTFSLYDHTRQPHIPVFYKLLNQGLLHAKTLGGNSYQVKVRKMFTYFLFFFFFLHTEGVVEAWWAVERGVGIVKRLIGLMRAGSRKEPIDTSK